MKKTKIEITIYEYNNIEELAPADRILLLQAIEAAKNAYAPYSKFKVGASVLLENGDSIHGNNQENAAYPSGLCAERVALFYANAHFPSVAIKAIAIHAIVNDKPNEDPVYPCGACRQALLECENRYGKPIKIIMGGAKNIKVVQSIKDLLPLSFVLSN